MTPKAPTNPLNDLLEKELQKQVRKFAEDMGWRVAVTWTSIRSPKGWPDLFCARRGEIVAIELKRENPVRSKVSPEQKAWLEELAKVPGVKFAGVIRPSDWFAGKLDDVLR